jgi:hypothetical protein
VEHGRPFPLRDVAVGKGGKTGLGDETQWAAQVRQMAPTRAGGELGG